MESKMKYLNITMLILSIAFSGAALAKSKGESHENELKEIILSYNHGLTTKDVDKILSLYSSSPVFMPEYAPAAVGRDAIRKSYEWVFATLKLNGIFHFDEIEIIGDYAMVRTHSTGKFTVIATGVEAGVANTEFFVFKREAKKWKIHRYIFTASAPPANAK